MTTKKDRKSTSAGAHPLRADATELDIKGINRATLKATLLSIGKSRTAVDSAATAASDGSFVILQMARTCYVESTAAGIPLETIVKGWTAETKAVLPALAKAKWRFVAVSTGPDGEPKYKFTGHGDNIMSIAKGSIEHEINPDDCVDPKTQKPSYRAVKTAVQNARAGAATADVKQLVAIRKRLAEGIAAWKKLVNRGNDYLLIETACEEIETMSRVRLEQDVLQAELQAKADAAVDEAEKADNAVTEVASQEEVDSDIAAEMARLERETAPDAVAVTG